MLSLLLALAQPAMADAPDNWKFSLDGYYRVRGFVFPDMFPGQVKAGTYMTHRIRLQPGLNFQDRAKFFIMADMLDGAVFGDNQSVASTALFAGDPTNTSIKGTAMDPLTIKRAWMEFKVPIGLVRVGRQASNWGMGLLANEGNGFDDTFGENQYGSTYDRAIFATRPISIVQTILKKRDSGIPLVVAVGVDRLVEDPLIQYYGYKCDPDKEGEAGCTESEDHGYTEDRTEDNRSDTWWVDGQDDVWEMIYVLSYRGEGVALPGGRVGDLIGGVYAVNRMQTETNSNVLILDAYGKVEVANIYAEGEILHIGGNTEAVSLAGAENVGAESPLFKKADIWGYVIRAGYQNRTFTGYLEHGYASGDPNVADADFSGRPLHPDYNVGLLLYEEIIARSTATVWGPDAQGLWSNGGVYNSRYIFPTVKYRPLDNWEILGGFLAAWPDKADGSRIRCSPDDPVPEGQDPDRWKDKCNATASMLGYEVDLAVKHNFHDHINFTMEGGYAHVTDRIPLSSVGLDYRVNDKGQEVGDFWTFQTRIAYEF
jgi:hypothetical protein